MIMTDTAEGEGSDIAAQRLWGAFNGRPALEHGLEGWVGFGNEGRAFKTLYFEGLGTQKECEL